MANAFDKLAFDTAQMARVSWFFGQKLLAARLARPVPVPPELRGRKIPDRQRLLADLWRLIEQDWRNIEAGIYAMPEDREGGAIPRTPVEGQLHHLYDEAHEEIHRLRQGREGLLREIDVLSAFRERVQGSLPYRTLQRIRGG